MPGRPPRPGGRAETTPALVAGRHHAVSGRQLARRGDLPALVGKDLAEIRRQAIDVGCAAVDTTLVSPLDSTGQPRRHQQYTVGPVGTVEPAEAVQAVGARRRPQSRTARKSPYEPVGPVRPVRPVEPVEPIRSHKARKACTVLKTPKARKARRARKARKAPKPVRPAQARTHPYGPARPWPGERPFSLLQPSESFCFGACTSPFPRLRHIRPLASCAHLLNGLPLVSVARRVLPRPQCRQDDRRIDDIANGLPAWGGVQLAASYLLRPSSVRRSRARVRRADSVGS